MKAFVIEKLKKQDAPLISKAFAKALEEDFNYYPLQAREKFKNIWSEKYFRSNKKLFFVAKTEERVVGFLIGRPQWLDTGLATIEWLWVEKDFRGQRIATELLQKAEEACIKTGHHKLNLEADNPKSWSIYPKLGFTEEGFEKNHAWHHDEYRYGKVLTK